MILRMAVVLALAVITTYPLAAVESTFYVGLVRSEEVADVLVDTELTVANDTAEARSFTVLFIPSYTDGTDRPEEMQLQPVVVQAFGSRLLTGLVPEGERGMLEITADEELAFQAQLVTTIGEERKNSTPVPIISSENFLPGGDTAVLQNILRRNEGPLTNIGVINLSHESNPCTFNVDHFDGTPVVSALVQTLEPLSHLYFPDALRFISPAEVVNLRLTTSCDGDFFVFGDVLDRQTGVIDVLPYSQRGLSRLAPPGTELPELPCPPDAICFDRPGVYFTPTRSDPGRLFTVPLPAGTYNRFVVHQEVEHGGWQAVGKRYEILWFVIGGNRDQIFYVLMIPPNKVRLTHGIGTDAVSKIKVDRNVPIVPGETYAFDLLYDTDQRIVEMIMTHDGEELVRIQSAPNVNRLTVGPNEDILIHNSFDGERANEPASFGWKYKNLFAEIYPDN